MAFDQRLTLKYDREIFGPSWIAATTTATANKSKSLLHSHSQKNFDFRNVNVVETCDELRLAMQSQSGGCESPQTEMRTYLNLCYGTLKIFEHQVNNLLEMSRDLASLAKGSYEVKSLTVTKRKSSCKVQTIVSKKARFSKTTRKITKSTMDLGETNYTGLLDEWEKWLRESERIQLEGTMNLDSQIDPNIINIANLHIQEITTIRETHAEFDLPELDGDLNFGNATVDELNGFLNFVDDKTEMAEKKIPRKAKSTMDDNLYGKIPKLNDDCYYRQEDWLIEAAHCETSLVAYDDGPTTISGEEKQPEAANSIDDYTENHSAYTNQPLMNEKESTSTQSIIGPLQSSPMTERRGKTRQSKIIVDQCLMLDKSKMLAQLENGTSAFNPIKNLAKKAPSIIFNRLNRRSITQVHFKLKRKMGKENSSKEYLNILSDILGQTVHSDLAREIYPNWNETKQNTSNNNNRINELNYNLIETDQIDLMPTPPSSSKETTFDFSVNATTDELLSNEWNVEGVMMKLLTMWRRESSDVEIDAKCFCMSTKNRIDAALAFSSLLTLAAKNFIVITKNSGDSIEMKTIQLGSESIKLIRDIQISTKES